MSERLTDNPTLFRLRVRYGKRDRLKYLGHLEVIHTIERIVRRAGLPYAVTQGFSPHMRVGFSRRGSARTIWCSCSTPMPTTRAPCVRKFCFLLLMFCCRA